MAEQERETMEGESRFMDELFTPKEAMAMLRVLSVAMGQGGGIDLSAVESKSVSILLDEISCVLILALER